MPPRDPSDPATLPTLEGGGRGGVAFDVEPGTYVNGTPAMPYMLGHRLEVLHRRLPELFKRVDALESLLKEA